MRLRYGSRRLIGALVGGIALVAGPASPQFTPFAHDAATILEGNWQSCREADGRFTERVYDHVVNGVGRFEVHMGPRNEFAMFNEVQDDHREHTSGDNLLKPSSVPMESGPRATQRWEVPSLGVALTVTLAGGFRTDCESWFVVLEPLKKPSH
jgi:hypothetical protein